MESELFKYICVTWKQNQSSSGSNTRTNAGISVMAWNDFVDDGHYVDANHDNDDDYNDDDYEDNDDQDSDDDHDGDDDDNARWEEECWWRPWTVPVCLLLTISPT